MSDYGLTGLRDEDGERKPVEYDYEYGSETVTVKFVPPTLAQSDELEQLLGKDDLDVDEIQEPLNEYLVEPSIPDDESWTLPEFNCYINAIYEWSMGGGYDLGSEIADELDERTGGEGN